MLLLLMAVAPALAADGFATFTIDARLEGATQGSLEARVTCDRPGGLQLELSVPAGGSRTITVPAEEGGAMVCEVTAQALPGQRLRYLGDGGSDYDPEAGNCRFMNVRAGHANFCQVRVENRDTSLTVFKHWIGTSEPQDDTRVFLECGPDFSFEPLEINLDKPATWRFDFHDAVGLPCSVREEARETFIPDVSDCANLVIRPGAREECTVVNTKVVKMIEMFNRYGLAIMIALFMLVGGFAARRMI